MTINFDPRSGTMTDWKCNLMIVCECYIFISPNGETGAALLVNYKLMNMHINNDINMQMNVKI